MSREYVLQPFRAPIDLHIDYARELNEQQLAAVTAVPSPALVIAGAGSGKTRTLTYRVAYLLEQGIPPDRILLLTFTNKAAREMMRRVNEILGQDLSDLWGGTFHSIGHRILRRHADRLGYGRDFTILDREDAKDLIQACLDDAEIEVQATRFPKAEVLGEIFSFAMNTQKPVRQILAEQFEHFVSVADAIDSVAQRYRARKRETNVMDFDDLLVLWLKLLLEHADVCELYQRRFQFILVDEYQDTNRLQADLIDLLAARHQNVMVVGDDSQSIYSWRGANFLNILEFPKRYPNARVYKIETNYRSTPEILSVANAAIHHNARQFAKQLTASRRAGLKPALVVCNDSSEQAAFVAQRALQLRDEGINLNEMAVLYRSHFHALELQLELTRRNIPFSITSGIRFFEQAHIKDVVAYLKFICNPHDELAFKRLVRMLPGVGGKTADKLWKEWLNRLPTKKLPPPDAPAPTHPLDAEQSTASPAQDSAAIAPSENEAPSAHAALATALQSMQSVVPRKTAVDWVQFVATISQLETKPVRGDAARMLKLVLEAGYTDYLEGAYTNHRLRLDDIEQLALFARQFASLEEFLSQLALLSNLEAEEDKPVEKDEERLSLSTIHQAKGLEFSVVFMIMLCEGLFPSVRSTRSEEQIEEERRLFYVAITRARDELYLAFPLLRMSSSGDAMQQPSRFLKEIPKELIEEWNLRSFRSYY
jgi:DNA helicase II / ATP-dependent DNA helicase PcrA